MSLATPSIALITTGGTIASKRGGENGASTPVLSGGDLMGLVPGPEAKLRAVNLMAKDSASLTLSDMQRISSAVEAELEDGAVDGIIVLHGTDAMEETALLVQLQCRIGKPVIFTGAQFTADHPPDADGPENIAAAIRLASDPSNAEKGVQIAFGGRIIRRGGEPINSAAATAMPSAPPVRSLFRAGVPCPGRRSPRRPDCHLSGLRRPPY
ncbi:hypothetical protein Q644_22575 [Brucella intermedia 229E]|uniref:L-asparaginase N-terminal domain-containing protein n=1 Tax=Brucella intermedia 229E TaxID=1337887 RepID=U4V5P4_9HYPH|nr:hypothetical protein Q644_22575 [Brucella intermedia 229E]